MWSGGWVSELKKRERSGEVYDENARGARERVRFLESRGPGRETMKLKRARRKKEDTQRNAKRVSRDATKKRKKKKRKERRVHLN